MELFLKEQVQHFPSWFLVCCKGHFLRLGAITKERQKMDTLCQPCPVAEFQPAPIPSHYFTSTHCHNIHTLCSSPQKLTVGAGNTTSDNMCKCNYLKGYRPVPMADYDCKVFESSSGCVCKLEPCPPTQMMHPTGRVLLLFCMVQFSYSFLSILSILLFVAWGAICFLPTPLGSFSDYRCVYPTNEYVPIFGPFSVVTNSNGSRMTAMWMPLEIVLINLAFLIGDILNEKLQNCIWRSEAYRIRILSYCRLLDEMKKDVSEASALFWQSSNILMKRQKLLLDMSGNVQ